jgi:hypothetical protein
LVPLEEARQIIQIVVTSGAVTQQVGDVINEEAKNAPAIPSPDNRISRRSSEGTKNLFRAALSYIWQHKVKFATGAAGVSTFIAKWMLKSEAFLLKYFAESPKMLETIQGIIAFLKTLPLA